MKKYYNPEIEILEILTEEVLSVSSVSDGGASKGWDGGVVEDYGSAK